MKTEKEPDLIEIFLQDLTVDYIHQAKSIVMTLVQEHNTLDHTTTYDEIISLLTTILSQLLTTREINKKTMNLILKRIRETFAELIFCYNSITLCYNFIHQTLKELETYFNDLDESPFYLINNNLVIVMDGLSDLYDVYMFGIEDGSEE